METMKANDAKIPGLRIYKGIERFGNKEAYCKILSSYVYNTPTLLRQMVDVNERNLADYAMAAHGIKGNNLNICADTLGARAEQLEQAAKRGNYTYIKRHNDEFVHAANELIEKVTALLRSLSGRMQKPVAAEPDHNVLAALKAACDIYDIDGVDWAMEELDKYDYINPALYNWLKEETAILGFQDIAKRLEAFESVID